MDSNKQMKFPIFRLLCPADKTGKVIGKSGCIISNIRSETCSKIRIDNPIPGYDERIIIISADPSNSSSNPHLALVMVFDRIEGCGEERKEAVCRMVVNEKQVGLILERVRGENNEVKVMAFGKEYIPASAEGEDEIVHITGSLSDVRNALITVSGCLQEFHKTEAMKFSNTKPFVSTFRGSEAMKFTNSKPFVSNLRGSVHSGHMDSLYVQRSYLTYRGAADFHSRAYSADCKNIIEKDVTFRILCSNDRVGSLIGKSGTIIQALQNETGASIRVVDTFCNSDERVIIISSLENIEMKGSNAQDAVLRVHSRIVEGFEKGSHVLARLLVHAQLVGCLLGKGGSIISEMRRSTGADIRIFPKEQVPKYDQENDEIVQIAGSFELVQEALFSITSRIREAIFFIKPYTSSSMSQHSSDNPPKRFKNDMNPVPSHTSDSNDQGLILYSRENIGICSSDHSPSSRSCCHQVTNAGNTRGFPNTGFNSCWIARELLTPAVTSMTVEVVLSRQDLGFAFGEDEANLTTIKKLSGATVTICDPKHGESEGKVIISGNSTQVEIAHSLLQGFIFHGVYESQNK